MDYSALTYKQLSLRERFGFRRLIRYTPLSILIATLFFGSILLQPLSGMNRNAYIALGIGWIFTILIVTYTQALFKNTRQPDDIVLRKFARDNGMLLFDYITHTTSITAKSYTVSRELYRDFWNDRGYFSDIGFTWQLYGHYKHIPFKIERLYSVTSLNSFNNRGGAPHYMTALALPTRSFYPRLAFRSIDLDAGMSVFKTSSILPYPSLHPIELGTVVNEEYLAYSIDSMVEISEINSLQNFLWYLSQLDDDCDVEVSDGVIYLFFNGSLQPTAERVKRWLHLVEEGNRL